jgi:plastocyanin
MAPIRFQTFAVAVALTCTAVPACAASVQITMQNLEVLPKEVTAKVGDTVEWINKDAFVHSATAPNGDFDVQLPVNKTASVVVKKAGTVEYYCRYHPNMRATLKIEP